MPQENLDAERTAVVATYSTRRDAEIAHDALEQEDIDAFISADDAGGMHPHLQLTQGVKLLVLERALDEAREVLEGLDSEVEAVPDE